MADEGANGVLADLEWRQRRQQHDHMLRSGKPWAVRFDMSADLYEELRRSATPEDRWLYGAYTVPSAFAAQVVVHYDWPAGVMGVEMNDGSIESYQY